MTLRPSQSLTSPPPVQPRRRPAPRRSLLRWEMTKNFAATYLSSLGRPQLFSVSPVWRKMSTRVSRSGTWSGMVNRPNGSHACCRPCPASKSGSVRVGKPRLPSGLPSGRTLQRPGSSAGAGAFPPPLPSSPSLQLFWSRGLWPGVPRSGPPCLRPRIEPRCRWPRSLSS